MIPIDFKLLLDGLPVIYLLTDSNLRIEYANDMGAEILGGTRNDLLQKTVYDIVDQSEHPRLRRLMSECIEGTMELDMEYRFRIAGCGGVKFDTGIHMAMVDTGADSNVMLGLTLTDLSEHCAELGELNMFRTAIEQIDDVIIVTDTEGVIEYVNPAFENMTQYRKDEVIGQTPSLLKTDYHPAKYYQDLWDSVKAGKTWRGKFINRKKDGSLYTESATISPIRDKSGNIVKLIAIKSDVTMVENLHRRLRQSEKMDAVGRMSAVIVHDFNNILQVMNGYAQLLCEVLPDEDPNSGYANNIFEGGRRAKILIDELNQFCNSHARKLEYVDVNALLYEMRENITTVLNDQHSLELILGPDVGLVHAENVGLYNVITNLCTNARDAMPDGGQITISTSKVRSQEFVVPADMQEYPRHEYYVCIEVADDGCGIPEDIVSKVFDPFFTTKMKGEGTGLGLPSAYATVENYDGFIEIDSRAGVGTKATVYLPSVNKVKTAPQNDDRVEPVEVKKPARRLTILVAEDEPMVRRFTINALKKEGFKILETKDGAEALETYRQNRGEIDLALLDVVMPRMHGTEVRDEIRAGGDRMPIVFITGYSESHTNTDFESLPENERVLYKPCEIRKILQTIYSLT